MTFAAPYSKTGELGCWGWFCYGSAPDERVPILKCTNGHVAVLENHTIADDGTVTPSVVCPREGCEFHEWVILGGWKANG